MISLLLLGAALLAAPAGDPVADLEGRISGSFVYVPDESDDIDRAINRAISRMNFLVRQVARRRLRNTTRPAERITIATTEQAIDITADGEPPVRTAPDGPPVSWTRADGEVLQVATSWRGDRLVQTFTAPDGGRENVYSLAADGRTLTVDVTVSSPRLPEAVEYRMIYRRAE